MQTLHHRDCSKEAKDMLWTGLTGARVLQPHLPQRVQATQRYVCILASERVLEGEVAAARSKVARACTVLDTRDDGFCPSFP